MKKVIGPPFSEKTGCKLKDPSCKRLVSLAPNNLELGTEFKKGR